MAIAMRGTIPSATKIDAIKTKIIVKGMDAMNFPSTPLKKNKGTKNTTVAMVPAINGHAYSLIEATAASSALSYIFERAWIASITTIPESTRIPIASMSEKSEIKLIVFPDALPGRT